jgi:hypothetical protein
MHNETFTTRCIDQYINYDVIKKVIEVDISGRPPIPLAQNEVSMLEVFLGFFGPQTSGAVLRP